MDDIRYFHLNMIGDTNPPGYIAPPPDEWTTPELTSNIYRVLLDQRQDVISETLVTLADSKGHTAIYHCAAGTDRTGIISALLLGLAGVPADTIVNDYALSAHGLRLLVLAEGIPITWSIKTSPKKNRRKSSPHPRQWNERCSTLATSTGALSPTSGTSA